MFKQSCKNVRVVMEHLTNVNGSTLCGLEIFIGIFPPTVCWFVDNNNNNEVFPCFHSHSLINYQCLFSQTINHITIVTMHPIISGTLYR